MLHLLILCTLEWRAIRESPLHREGVIELDLGRLSGLETRPTIWDIASVRKKKICCKPMGPRLEFQYKKSNLEGYMETYTIIKKGKNIQHCLDIPREFLDETLEITIKPIRKQGDLRKKIENLFKEMPEINPFKTIDDPIKWQKEQRSEW